MAKKTPKATRTLVLFLLATALLYGAAALGGTWKPQLGLDLEGGTRITLQAAGNPGQSRMNLARSIIEQRANGSGVTEASTKIQGGSNIVVEVPGKNAKSIVDAVKRTAQLRFRLVAAAAGPPSKTTPSPSASPSASPSGSPSSTSSTKPKATAKPTKKTNNRPGALGADSPSPSAKAPKATGSATPGAQTSPSPSPTTGSPRSDTSVANAIAFQNNPPQTALAEFSAYTCPTGAKAQAPVDDSPGRPLVTCDSDGNKYLLSPALIEGTQLKTASYGTPLNSVGWAVDLSFKGKAVDTFGEVTGKLAGTGKTFAIVLDGKVLSAPTVNQTISDGSAQITGRFTQGQARSLSNALKFGALPVKFKQPSVETIGPSLAGDQLRAGILAGIVGLAVVMVYCLLYYRGLGLVVIASLVAAGAITYAVVLVLAKTASFTLTLPGIAGLIVAVGITADSFIVYFERIRDEMRTGKSMRVAVELGWARARNTCLAADTVSFLAAIVLYVFTIGVVKGFAFALGISTLIDLAVFFWFTKPMMTLLARIAFFNSGGRFSGLSEQTLGIDGDALRGRRPARVGRVA